MQKVHTLIVGAGISGLSFANFIDGDDYLILERDQEIGGYCKTILQDGFVWDYSGHFFHFRHPDIEQYLRDRMPDQEIATVVKEARILYKDCMVDFPFQKNIHQLPQEEFIDCLHDLYFRPDGEPSNFKEMLVQKFGQGIAEKFLIPYNEKLYACDLTELDVNAMGRFFPHADLEEIIANFRRPDNASYNATFTYPHGGAIEYVNALARGVNPDAICLGESMVRLDLEAKVAHTSAGRSISFEYLVTSVPFARLLEMSGLDVAPDLFSSNKVAVFNLGFDAKGLEGVHWIYLPERKYSFYRVGFYDNILAGDRMSLYVEVGKRTEEEVDMEALRAQVLEDLRASGLVTDQNLVSYHQIVLDPAYVHITQASQEAFGKFRNILQTRGVYPVGRYGGWTYCSIEDNILETRELAEMFNMVHSRKGGAT